MAGVATKVSYSMRCDISEKIDRMPLSYFDRVPNGEVLSRITNDVDTCLLYTSSEKVKAWCCVC